MIIGEVDNVGPPHQAIRYSSVSRRPKGLLRLSWPCSTFPDGGCPDVMQRSGNRTKDTSAKHALPILVCQLQYAFPGRRVRLQLLIFHSATDS